MNQVETEPAVILVVDDEPQVLADVSAALQSSGYQCHTCQDADAAIAMAQRTRPDLIISDINLAGRSGLEMCEKIRAEEPLRETPLMFLSGAQIPDVVRRAHAAGGTYYLRKPFDPSVLSELVDKALWMPHLVHAQLTP